MNDFDFEITLEDTPEYIDKDLSVTVNRQILTDIMNYAKGDTERERGGFLLGYLTETPETYRINITDYITAKHTVNRTASLTFTHKSWQEAEKEIEKNHRDKIMLGWFHSHPGYGVFLSGMDMFIENNFFNLPYQVAYVVDPLSGKDGFFGWEDQGKIKKIEDIKEIII